MLSTPSVYNLDGAIIPTKRELHFINTIADLDLIQQTLIVICESGRFVEIAVYLFEESIFRHKKEK